MPELAKALTKPPNARGAAHRRQPLSLGGLVSQPPLASGGLIRAAQFLLCSSPGGLVSMQQTELNRLLLWRRT